MFTLTDAIHSLREDIRDRLDATHIEIEDDVADLIEIAGDMHRFVERSRVKIALSCGGVPVRRSEDDLDAVLAGLEAAFDDVCTPAAARLLHAAAREARS